MLVRESKGVFDAPLYGVARVIGSQGVIESDVLVKEGVPRQCVAGRSFTDSLVEEWRNRRGNFQFCQWEKYVVGQNCCAGNILIDDHTKVWCNKGIAK